jgi:hypothetical protein
MSVAALRAIELVHAVVAWLASVALVASAAAFAAGDRARRAARWLGAIATALVIGAGGLGFALHDPYRARLRQKLFLASPSLGWWFERKHHAAFAAILLAVSALAARAWMSRAESDARLAPDLRRSALLASIASATLALLASIVSTIVARHARF